MYESATQIKLLFILNKLEGLNSLIQLRWTIVKTIVKTSKVTIVKYVNLAIRVTYS